ncbi:hypothetical protein FOZ61_009654 [Perkinsus olseni]|uniref:Uncharacterized protein n=1 Tax=Perkinsus olseni TaxID=32597 RepID=A0A7J6M4P0_PEROL|nr:hypothetical protein FOZ61_009654 [Perkinsus olseni]
MLSKSVSAARPSLTTAERAFTTWSDHAVIASRNDCVLGAINKRFPNEDPRGVQDRKIPQLVKKLQFDVSGGSPKQDELSMVKSLWLEMYERRLHDAAYDEAADSGLTECTCTIVLLMASVVVPLSWRTYLVWLLSSSFHAGVSQLPDTCRRCLPSEATIDHRHAWSRFVFGTHSEDLQRFLDSNLSTHCDAAFSRMIVEGMGGSVSECDSDRSSCLERVLYHHPCPVHFTLDIVTTSVCAYFLSHQPGVSALLLSLLTTFSAEVQPCLDSGDWPGFTSVDWLRNVPAIIRSLGSDARSSTWRWSSTNLTLSRYVETHPCSMNSSSLHDIDRCCGPDDDKSGVVNWTLVNGALSDAFSHSRFFEVRLPLFESLIEPASATLLELATTVTCRSGLLALQLLGHIQERSASGLRNDQTGLMQEGVELLLRSFSWPEIARSTYPLFGLVSRAVATLRTTGTDYECSDEAKNLLGQLNEVVASLQPLESLRAISPALEQLVAHHDDDPDTCTMCHMHLMSTTHAALAAREALSGKDAAVHVEQASRWFLDTPGGNSDRLMLSTPWPLFEFLSMVWPGYAESHRDGSNDACTSVVEARPSSPSWTRRLEALTELVSASAAYRTFGSADAPPWRAPLMKELKHVAAAAKEAGDHGVSVALLETLDQDVQWRHPKDTVTNFSPEQGACKLLEHAEIHRRWQEFRQSPHNTTSSRYINGICKPCLGIALKWRADYIRVDPAKCPQLMDRLYRQYDMVLVLDYSPAGSPRPIAPTFTTQVWLYMPSEPHALQGRVHLPDGYSPVVVDEYGVVSPGSRLEAVELWYRYPVAALREALGQPIENRGDCVLLFGQPDDKLAAHLINHHNVRVVFTGGSGSGNTQYQYYQLLRESCKVAVLPWDGRFSAGQVIADGALMGVPVVAPRQKLFARLLLPSMFSYISNDVNEITARVLLLLSRPDLYRHTVEVMEEGLLGLLDWERLETPGSFLLRVNHHRQQYTAHEHVVD